MSIAYSTSIYFVRSLQNITIAFKVVLVIRDK